MRHDRGSAERMQILLVVTLNKRELAHITLPPHLFGPNDVQTSIFDKSAIAMPASRFRCARLN